MDFNDANPQRVFDVIPADTVATLHMTVRPGNAGEGGLLRRSKDGNSEALDCEFTVVDGPYAKRKVWGLFTLVGTTPNHATAAEISRSRLRAILESARGIRPDDTSAAAKQARQVASYQDFDGLRFVGRIGVEPARDSYPAKNALIEAITPDRRDWHPVEQIVKHDGATATAGNTTGGAPAPAKPEPTKIEKPQWARKAS
jgi:hypothetical protein